LVKKKVENFSEKRRFTSKANADFLRLRMVKKSAKIENPKSKLVGSDNQVSISPTVYEQLLHPQIPKAQKDTNDLTIFFALLGSSLIKAACKRVDEITYRQPFSDFDWSRNQRKSEFRNLKLSDPTIRTPSSDCDWSRN